MRGLSVTPLSTSSRYKKKYVVLHKITLLFITVFIIVVFLILINMGKISALRRIHRIYLFEASELYQAMLLRS